MLDQLPTYLTQPVATLLGVLLLAYLGYVFGRWKTQHERLYERRAEVIAALFECFVDVDQKFYSLVHPTDLQGEPNKQEKAKLAAESFNELQNYHRKNSLWLSHGTSRRVESFIDRYRETFYDFLRSGGASDRSDPSEVREWLNVWERFDKDSPKIRGRLETEFRAALGVRRAKLRRFLYAIQDMN